MEKREIALGCPCEVNAELLAACSEGLACARDFQSRAKGDFESRAIGNSIAALEAAIAKASGTVRIVVVNF